MNENVKKVRVYEKPKLMDYGNIRMLTAAATGTPGGMDVQYFLGHINNLNGDPDPSFSA